MVDLSRHTAARPRMPISAWGSTTSGWMAPSAAFRAAPDAADATGLPRRAASSIPGGTKAANSLSAWSASVLACAAWPWLRAGEERARLGEMLLVAELQRQMHERHGEAGVGRPEDLLLHGERVAEGVLGAGEIVDAVLAVAEPHQPVIAVEVAAAEGLRRQALVDELAGGGARRRRLRERVSGEARHRRLDRRHRRGHAVGHEGLAAIGRGDGDMGPAAVALGALHEHGGDVVEDAGAGWRRAGGALVEVGAPQARGRELPQRCGAVALLGRLEDAPAGLAPGAAPHAEGAAGIEVDVAQAAGPVFASLADLVLADRGSRLGGGRRRVRHEGVGRQAAASAECDQRQSREEPRHLLATHRHPPRVIVLAPRAFAQNRSSSPTLSRLTVGSVNCCCCGRMLTLLTSAGFTGTMAGSTVQVIEPMAQPLNRYWFSDRPLLSTSWAAVGPPTLSTVPKICDPPLSPNTARFRALIELTVMWPRLAASSTDAFGAEKLVSAMLPLAPPGWKLEIIEAAVAPLTASSAAKGAPVVSITTD